MPDLFVQACIDYPIHLKKFETRKVINLFRTDEETKQTTTQGCFDIVQQIRD